MSTFTLRIGTPDGLLCEGDVERVVCRSVGGDLAILARHCNFCTALGMGEASVVMEDGTRRTAACIGGMLSVMNAFLLPHGNGKKISTQSVRRQQKNALKK